MNLFETLEIKKSSGEVLDFNSLTREELKQIWYEDGATDFYIGKLFDVSQHTVNKRRRELNLMWNDCVWEDRCKQPEFQKKVSDYLIQNNSHTINDLKHILNQRTTSGGEK